MVSQAMYISATSRISAEAQRKDKGKNEKKKKSLFLSVCVGGGVQLCVCDYCG